MERQLEPNIRFGLFSEALEKPISLEFFARSRIKPQREHLRKI